jgi:hypothetical protein
VLALVPRGDRSAETRLARALGVKASWVAPPASSPPNLARAQAALFEERAIGTVGPAAPDEASVVVFSAPGEAAEAAVIARAVLRRAARGVAFDRMAVLLRQPGHYRAHFAEAFARARIPCWLGAGTALPEGADLEDEAPEKEPPEAASLWAPRHWERLLAEASVIGQSGVGRWERRLAGLRAELQRDLEVRRLEDPEDPAIQAIERSQQALSGLTAFALPLLADLAVFHERAVLAPRLVGLVQRPPEAAEGKVFVAEMALARGHSFDVVFVPGVGEGEIPGRVLCASITTPQTCPCDVPSATELNGRMAFGHPMRGGWFAPAG